MTFLFRAGESAATHPDVLAWLGEPLQVPGVKLMEEVLATVFDVPSGLPRGARTPGATPMSDVSAVSGLTAA